LYADDVSKREKELEFEEGWEVPEILRFNENYIQEERKKSVLQPFFTDGKWKSENTFMDFIDGEVNIEWWFKNGDRDRTFFAVPYANGEPKPFYVDFIIKLKDGRLCLFDTKSGFTAETAGPKAGGLYEYIKKGNSKGKKLFGGIVTNTDPVNYKGRWVYFDKQGKELVNNDLTSWKNLEF
jgi:type III restriction enzyme